MSVNSRMGMSRKYVRCPGYLWDLQEGSPNTQKPLWRLCQGFPTRAPNSCGEGFDKVRGFQAFSLRNRSAPPEPEKIMGAYFKIGPTCSFVSETILRSRFFAEKPSFGNIRPNSALLKPNRS